MTVFRPPSVLLLVAATLSFGLIGCSGSASTTAPSGFPNHSAEQIHTLIRSSTDTISSYTARARVSVRSPQRNRSFNADMQQLRSDSLLMRFSLFGFEGGRMLLTRDSVFVYDSRNNTLRVGGLAEAQQLLPAPLKTDEVFANMLGIIAPDPSTAWDVQADSARYYLSDPSDTRQWTVDPSRWRVVRYTRTDPEGRVLEKRSFSDFQSVGGLTLPHTVTFERPIDNMKANIEYKSILLNPSELPLSFNVPSNVPRQPIR